MDKVIVKKLQRKEALKMSGTFKRSLEEDFNYYPRKIIPEFKEMWDLKFFQKRKPLVFIAKDNGNVVGFIIAKRPWKGSGVGEINWLWVDPKYRRKGIGRKLLGILTEKYKELSCHKMTLEADNPKSQNYYPKAGFVREGYKKNDYYHLDFVSYAKFLEKK